MTLIEVLAVVVILGLLAATLTYGLSGRIGRAKREIAKTQMAQISSALETFRLERAHLPTQGEGLALLGDNPQAAYFLEPGKLVDPWGRPYLYLIPGPRGYACEIVSYGEDGQPGGSGDQADLTSTDLSRR